MAHLVEWAVDDRRRALNAAAGIGGRVERDQLAGRHDVLEGFVEGESVLASQPAVVGVVKPVIRVAPRSMLVAMDPLPAPAFAVIPQKDISIISLQRSPSPIPVVRRDSPGMNCSEASVVDPRRRSLCTTARWCIDD
jgi:hypothetical protein